LPVSTEKQSPTAGIAVGLCSLSGLRETVTDHGDRCRPFFKDYCFVNVIAVFEKPDPFSVPVIDFPFTVAVRSDELYPGAAIVRPSVGAEYVPVIVTAIGASPVIVPVPVTVPEFSESTRLMVNGFPEGVVPLPFHVPETVVFGPEESLQAAIETSIAMAIANGRMRALVKRPMDVSDQRLSQKYCGGI